MKGEGETRKALLRWKETKVKTTINWREVEKKKRERQQHRGGQLVTGLMRRAMMARL